MKIEIVYRYQSNKNWELIGQPETIETHYDDEGRVIKEIVTNVMQLPVVREYRYEGNIRYERSPELELNAKTYLDEHGYPKYSEHDCGAKEDHPCNTYDDDGILLSSQGHLSRKEIEDMGIDVEQKYSIFEQTISYFYDHNGLLSHEEEMIFATRLDSVELYDIRKIIRYNDTYFLYNSDNENRLDSFITNDLLAGDECCAAYLFYDSGNNLIEKHMIVVNLKQKALTPEDESKYMKYYVNKYEYK